MMLLMMVVVVVEVLQSGRGVGSLWLDTAEPLSVCTAHPPDDDWPSQKGVEVEE